jgi:predicted Zn finger-like uncharacterized protein
MPLYEGSIMIGLVCPGCRTQLAVDEQSVGREVACPKCDMEFRAKPPVSEYARPVERRQNRHVSENRRTGFAGRSTCRCGSDSRPIERSEISTGGWVTFAVLVWLFPPLCWIGFFIKDRYLVCSDCGRRIR